MGLQASNTSGLDPGLFSLGHVARPCTRTLLLKLRPHTQALRFGKSSGEKNPSSFPKYHVSYSGLVWQTSNYVSTGFGRTGVKLSSKRMQSLELILQL